MLLNRLQKHWVLWLLDLNIVAQVGQGIRLIILDHFPIELLGLFELISLVHYSIEFVDLAFVNKLFTFWEDRAVAWWRLLRNDGLALRWIVEQLFTSHCNVALFLILNTWDGLLLISWGNKELMATRVAVGVMISLATKVTGDILLAVRVDNMIKLVNHITRIILGMGTRFFRAWSGGQKGWLFDAVTVMIVVTNIVLNTFLMNYIDRLRRLLLRGLHWHLGNDLVSPLHDQMLSEGFWSFIRLLEILNRID